MSMMAATVLLASAVSGNPHHFCNVERIEKRAGGVSVVFSPPVPDAFVIDIKAEKRGIFKGKEYPPPVRRIYIPNGARAMAAHVGSSQCILAASAREGRIGIEIDYFIESTLPGKTIGSSEFVLAK